MNRFEELFDRAAETQAVAPGRVNLIGEHTDYNGGLVLPTPIDRRTVVTLAATPGDEVRVASDNIDGLAYTYTLGAEARRGTWLDYVQGVTKLLRDEGSAVRGFDALVATELPLGGGLSSSASLLVALLRALRERFELALDDMAIALLAHRAESDFVGARVGIMDQVVTSIGVEGEALYLDTRDVTYRQVALPAEVELVVIDSGIEHRIAGAEYGRRREECERACRRLGVRSLRDLAPGDLERADGLPDPLMRRVRHVVTENARVERAVAALEGGRLDEFGACIDESHRSLRDDYEVSTEDVDRLVEALRAQPGVLGARITGGGFGGAVLGVAKAGTGDAAARHAAAAYRRATRREPVVYLPDEGDALTPDAAEVVENAEAGEVLSGRRTTVMPGTSPQPAPDRDDHGAPLFPSFFSGGFECSIHVLRSGRRLDLVESTRHAEFARADYDRLREAGMWVARDGVRWHVVERTPGRYDFSTVQPMVEAALESGVQVIWDLLHFGWPDHVDVMGEDWIPRFADYARAFAELLVDEGVPLVSICPVNEISFLSFAGGDAGFFNPWQHGRGNDLKRRLVAASIAACHAIREASPASRLVHTDPIIHVVARPDRPHDRDGAANHEAAQFESWDMISGRRAPELGGAPELLDVLGLNYYVHNQWFFPGGHGSVLPPSHPLHRPLADMLADVYERYRRPMFIAETGIEDEVRPLWLAHVAYEARAAIRRGVDLRAICLYPVVNHPGWDDDRHCHNGLWDYADRNGDREPHAPLLEELRRQQRAMQRLEAGAHEEELERPDAARLDPMAITIAEETDSSREG